jgi:hypothetical protein
MQYVWSLIRRENMITKVHTGRSPYKTKAETCKPRSPHASKPATVSRESDVDRFASTAQSTLALDTL